MNGNLWVGIDFGGTRTKIGLVDGENQLLAMKVQPTAKKVDRLLHDLKCAVDALLAEIGCERARLAGIGVSIGSYVFDATVVDTMCGFIDMPDGYPLGSVLEDALGLRCRVANDACLIALAESRFGAGKGYNRVLTLTLGTGMGFGFTVNGQTESGHADNHLAGHILVRHPGEEPALERAKCYCCIDGCMESTCSGTALRVMASEALHRPTEPEELFHLQTAGDAIASATICRYLTYLLRGLNQYVYLYAPDCIVLAGGVAHGLEAFLPEINNRLIASVYTGHHPQVRIGTLHEKSGVLGAAWLIAQEGNQ